MIEEAELFKFLSTPSSILRSTSQSSRELDFIDEDNVDTEEHDGHEKNTTTS